MIWFVIFFVSLVVMVGVYLEIEYRWLKYRWREGSYDYERKRRGR